MQARRAGFGNGPAAARVFFLRLLNTLQIRLSQIIRLGGQYSRKSQKRKQNV